MRNSNSNTPLPPVCSATSEGSVLLQGKRLFVPNVHLEEVIGNGANGVVVRGRHTFLNVPLAVKFWLSLRRGDSQDRMLQGIAEAQKLLEFDDYNSVVRIRTAGEVEGIFYSVMDYFHGETLSSWLKTSPSIGVRRRVAYRLVDEVCAFSKNNILHGDLHTKNVLIDTRNQSLLYGVEPRIGIIDFGTSLFNSKDALLARHWRVFIETLDQLVSPFRVCKLAHAPMPDYGDASALRSWLRRSLASVRHVLIRLGAESLTDGEDEHDFHKGEWANRDEMLADVFPVPSSVLKYANDLALGGAIHLTEDWLGRGSIWLPPDA